MMYLFMGIFTLAAVGLDQLVKYLAATRIQVGAQIPAIPGLFHLTQTHNYGAAFSSFEGMRWLFVAVFLLFAGAIVWEFSKKRWPFTTFDRWCIVSVFAGGLGNMIDRLRLGYVVDMIELEFINFPVFNVADCFITCGCVALMVHLVFFNKEFWKDEKK